MARAIHLVTQNVPGYGLTDGRFLPCSGVSWRTVSLSPCPSPGPYKFLPHFKTAALKCTSRGMFSVCIYRKNPDLSRKNNGGFSRDRSSRKNDERDGYESLEESDFSNSSKNRDLRSVSNPLKYQATSAPGSKEKGVIEIFKKIRAELRVKSSSKLEREKKTESIVQRVNGDELISSLIDVLRKHSTQKGKTSSSRSSSNKDFILDEPKSDSPLKKEKSTMGSMLDQSEQNGTFEREESKNSNNNVKAEAQGPGPESPTRRRPVSNFQRRSSVPQEKNEPIHSDSVTEVSRNGKSDRVHPNSLIDDHDHDHSIDGMLEEKYPDVDKGYNDDEVKEEKPIIDDDFSAMKMPELRSLAKSRGIKGFSKLKKSDLLELLSGGSK